ncbi:MAG TPA: stalk domain-containing protein [Caldisericia bacterium]|nr:stalk domain-containing protein [Caldisericia bacterium]HPF48432.1 stalk domain-containing protein [Caldisericia bacterium]HPI83388.1 stalk domain-containing protein [Caldisericia bacterium]HPQ92886.1 stalk domain-containing protein [Caldisericia bacterium]HRV74016.1 stalk domain-containing protein [Caldisericia bacterium]
MSDTSWVSIWGNLKRHSSIITSYPDKAALFELWKRDIGVGMCINPVAWDKKVFVYEHGAVVALDSGTGSVVWSFDCSIESVFSPIISDKLIYFPCFSGDKWCMYGLDTRNGTPKVRIDVTHEPRLHGVKDGFLYYSIIRQDQKGSYSMYFKYNITKKTFAWQIRLDGELNFDCFSDDYVFIRNVKYEEGNMFPPGSLVCIDDKDGDKVWENQIDENSQVDGHLICDDNNLYFGSNTGSLKALDASTGDQVWEKNFGEETFVGVKAMTQGKLIITVEGYGVACLDATNGDVLWETKNPEMDDAFVACTNYNVFFFYHDSYQEENTNPSKKSRFVVSDLATGDVVVEEVFVHTPRSIAIDENNLYISSDEGLLYCFERKVAILTILVLPTFNNVYMGESKQFTAHAFDYTEHEIEGLLFEWSVEPPEIGSIDKYGLFKPGQVSGRGLVYAKYKDMLGSAMVAVCGKPTIDIESFDFGQATKGESKTVEIAIGSSNSCMFEITDITAPDWIIAHNPKYDNLSPIVKVNLELSSKNLMPGKHSGEVLFHWDLGTLPLQVSVEVVETKKFDDLFEVSTSSIERLNIKSWEKSTFSYDVIVTRKTSDEENLSAKIGNASEWITIKKTTLDGGDILFAVTIKASEISPGVSVSDYLIISDDGVDGEIEIPILMEKNRYTDVTLKIGLSQAIVDDEEVLLDAPPRIVDGRTLVPIRIIAESLGAQVSWNATEKRIDIMQSNHAGKVTSISLWVGKSDATINGKKIQIDVAPMILDSRTYVPVRFISESFGAEVEWIQETKEIEITYDPLK